MNYTEGLFRFIEKSPTPFHVIDNMKQELAEQGYRYFMCTVHPENRYSRQNIIKQGFKPVKTALKYGGYRREIFLRDRSEGLD